MINSNLSEIQTYELSSEYFEAPIDFTKHGNIVSVTKYGKLSKKLTGNVTTVLGTIPEVFRPLRDYRTAINISKSSDLVCCARIFVGINGVVDIIPFEELSTDTDYIFGFTYGVPV